jgi:hypothetical protein
MDRREALRRTALLMGSALSAPAILGVLQGCTARPTIDWKPVFLTPEQGTIISEIAEIIIPKTDTAGAKEVGVPGFIDLMLKDVYKKEDQDRFIAGLTEFDANAKKEYGDPFLDLSADDRETYVRKVHGEAVKASRATSPAPEKPFILMTRELTLLGYFTSEVGATKVLQYQAVPGSYKGCVPLQEAGEGRTWAT